MKQLLPQSLKVRALLTLSALIIVSHSVSLLIFEANRRQVIISTEASDLADRIAGIVELARAFPVANRQQILSAAETQFLAMFPAVTGLEDVACQDNDFSRTLSEIIDAEFIKMPGLDAEVCVRSIDTSALSIRSSQRGFDVLVSINFSDDTETVFHAVLPEATPLIQDPVLIYLLSVTVATLLLAWYMVLKATAPLQNLARAAEKLGINIDTPQLPEQGPREVVAAARAFNDMQTRLARLVHGQTEMLAAISHDLRSALTRLQLRVDLLPENQEQEGLRRVIRDMRVMVESVLAFSRGVNPDEKPRETDINALVENLCKDQEEEGLPVICETSGQPLLLTCRPSSLRRAILNLIDNAVKYGKEAKLNVFYRPPHVIIQIRDRGPGIPDDKLETVMKPFYRLEASRNQDTGGVGLGLAITRNIIQAQGGEMLLINLDEGGLLAELRLPSEHPANEPVSGDNA